MTPAHEKVLNRRTLLRGAAGAGALVAAAPLLAACDSDRGPAITSGDVVLPRWEPVVQVRCVGAQQFADALLREGPPRVVQRELVDQLVEHAVDVRVEHGHVDGAGDAAQSSHRYARVVDRDRSVRVPVL